MSKREERTKEFHTAGRQAGRQAGAAGSGGRREERERRVAHNKTNRSFVHQPDVMGARARKGGGVG